MLVLYIRMLAPEVEGLLLKLQSQVTASCVVDLLVYVQYIKSLFKVQLRLSSIIKQYLTSNNGELS